MAIQDIIKKLKKIVIEKYKIKIISIEGNCSYYTCKNPPIIQLAKYENAINKLGALAHELGHHIYFQRLDTKDIKLALKGLQIYHYVGKCNYDYFLWELGAWKCSDNVLQEIGFNILNKIYIAHKKHCLGKWLEIRMQKGE
jgi:hypothetical protein